MCLAVLRAAWTFQNFEWISKSLLSVSLSLLVLSVAQAKKCTGLGYDILVFIYEKVDDGASLTARLSVRHAVFVARKQTGDYQTTYGLNEILRRNGNREDVISFLEERNLPLDEIGREALADQIMREPPELGYLTISNALQWRLQYRRVIDHASSSGTTGIEDLLA